MRICVILTGLAVTGLVPQLALADRRHDAYDPAAWRDRDHRVDRGDRYRDSGRIHDLSRERSDFRVDVRIGSAPRPPIVEQRQTRVWVEPVYRTVQQRIWVEPVYRIVHGRVWIDPVYRDETERVWIPDRWEIRETVYWDGCRNVVRRDRVLVEPGHHQLRHRRVLVCEGRWETLERQELVCAGHWQTVERQELVSPGHWEHATEHVVVHDRGWRDDPFINIHAGLRR